jgi:hypothetical protein
MSDEKKLNTNMKPLDGESETKLPYPFIKKSESAEERIRRHIAERLLWNSLLGKVRDE